MKSNSILILVFLLSITITLPSAKEGGGGEGGGEPTSEVSSGYNSDRSRDGINANLRYTDGLTKNLLFEFNVGLSNSFNSSEKREIQNHSISISNKYDPPSPWKLDVTYRYNRNYNYRPRDINQDEYKAYSRTHSLKSSLSYAFTEAVRTYLDVDLTKEVKESIVAGQSNPDTKGENNGISSSVEYDITPNTNVNVRYTGGIDSTEYTGSSERIADPVPPPKKGRTEDHRVYGKIVTDNSPTDSIDIDASFEITDQIRRDGLLPGLNSDRLRGIASSRVNFNPFTEFDFTNLTTLDLETIEYLNKADYEREFSTKIYDTDDTTLYNSAKLTIKPSKGSTASVTYDIVLSKRYRFKEGGSMPTYQEDSTAANSIYEDTEHKIVSAINSAIGDDLTFHLTHYYSSSHPDYLRNQRKNALTNLNNLDSNLGYDITDKLRTDVRTILNFKNVRYDYRPTSYDDVKESSISLSNNFTYSPTLVTKLTLGFQVKKDRNDYVNNPDRSYENIDRYINSNISHGLGKLFDVSCMVLYKYNYTNFLSNAESNIRQNTITVNPSTTINISESLYSTLRFTYSTVTKWNPYGDEDSVVNSWWQTNDYTTSFSITYTPLDDFTTNFNVVSGHNYRLENKSLRVKRQEDDDYYNVSLNINYEW